LQEAVPTLVPLVANVAVQSGTDGETVLSTKLTVPLGKVPPVSVVGLATDAVNVTC
jgi:hypothetical protein